jgi:uncharacterized membrane protein YhiD involved in acid resistance
MTTFLFLVLALVVLAVGYQVVEPTMRMRYHGLRTQFYIGLAAIALSAISACVYIWLAFNLDRITS